MDHKLAREHPPAPKSRHFGPAGDDTPVDSFAPLDDEAPRQVHGFSAAAGPDDEPLAARDDASSGGRAGWNLSRRSREPRRNDRENKKGALVREADPSAPFDDASSGGRAGFQPRRDGRNKKGGALAPEVPGAVSVSAEPPVTFAQQMRDFLHRNATWFLIAGFVLLLLQDVFGAHGLVAMRRSQKEADAVQKEIQELSDENQKLQNRVQSLKTDPATIERIAREEMGLARPGEYIFKLQPKPGEPSTPLAEPAEPPSSARPKKH